MQSKKKYVIILQSNNYEAVLRWQWYVSGKGTVARRRAVLRTDRFASLWEKESGMLQDFEEGRRVAWSVLWPMKSGRRVWMK